MVTHPPCSHHESRLQHIDCCDNRHLPVHILQRGRVLSEWSMVLAIHSFETRCSRFQGGQTVTSSHPMQPSSCADVLGQPSEQYPSTFYILQLAAASQYLRLSAAQRVHLRLHCQMASVTQSSGLEGLALITIS